MEKSIDKKTAVFVAECMETLSKEGSVKIRFETVAQFEAMQQLVKEGLLTKEDKIYSLTEKGHEYVKQIERDKIMEADKKRVEALKESVEVKFKQMDDNGRLVTLTETFELDRTDRLPVIRVDESGYRGLIDRRPGQHWSKFLGEAGRKLVRDRKLTKFYVENVKTGGKYLYIVP